MEHVVFYPQHDATPAFRRVASLEEAVRLVEHLRNVEGITEVSVHALTEVPLAFKAWYRVEVPGGENAATGPSAVEAAPLEASAAALPTQPDAVHHEQGQGEGEHGQAEHGQAEHGQAEHGQAEHGQAEHGQAEHGQTEHGQADQGPSDQGPSDQGPSDHGRSDQGQAADAAAATAEATPVPVPTVEPDPLVAPSVGPEGARSLGFFSTPA